MRHIEIKTSNKGNQTIKFIRVPTYEALSRYSNAINVIRGSGCYSYVGMQRTMNPQELSLGLGCVNVGTVIHEFMHALGKSRALFFFFFNLLILMTFSQRCLRIGFWHEQSRPDRDKYLTIYMSNVKTGMESNFYKFPTSQIGMTDLSYDYDSVMHYDKYAFSKNGKPTMEPKKKNVEIGNKQALSSTDVREIQRAYGNSAQRMSPLIGLAIFSMIINRIFQNFNF